MFRHLVVILIVLVCSFFGLGNIVFASGTNGPSEIADVSEIHNKYLKKQAVNLQTDAFSTPIKGQRVSKQLRKAFKGDALIKEGLPNSINAVLVSVWVELDNPYSYARIVLEDTEGKEYLLFASDNLSLSPNEYRFENICEETCDLPAITPKQIRTEVYKAKILIEDIIYQQDGPKIASGIPGQRAQDRLNRSSEQRRAKLQMLEARKRNNKEEWVSGETPLSKMSFAEKKKFFGGKMPNLLGFDTYQGGVFTLPDTYAETKPHIPSNIDSTIIKKFDWRDKHDAREVGSPYYADVNNGWITPIRNQGSCGSCWAFGVVAAAEGYINLYYNSKLDINLSEQDILSCSGAGTCSGGNPWGAQAYIKNSGVATEDCFPYSGTDQACTNKCSNWATKLWKIDEAGTDPTYSIAEKLEKGPAYIVIPEWSHALAVVGYELLPFNDYQFVAIVKNSWGTGWGDYGYARILVSGGVGTSLRYPIVTPAGAPTYSVSCFDKDGDGYCNWGLGPKPAVGCPVCADRPDDNDADPSVTLVEKCSNGVDDDNDGFIDCADPDCPEGITCYSTSGEQKYCNALHICAPKENCGNNVDDDADGSLDCADAYNCPMTASCDSYMVKQCNTAQQCVLPELNLITDYKSVGTEARSISADNNGNIYTVGNSSGKLVLAKFNNAGQEQWEKQFTLSSSSCYGMDVSAQPNGSAIFATGYCLNGSTKTYFTYKFDADGNVILNMPSNGGFDVAALNDALYVAEDGNLVRYNNTNGTQVWSRSISGGNLQDIKVVNNKIYLLQSIPYGASYLHKYDINGSLQWTSANLCPSNVCSFLRALAVNTDESIYITGRLSSQNGLFLAQYGPSANLVWQKAFPELGQGQAIGFSSNALYVGVVDNVYAPDLTHRSWVYKFNLNGDLRWKRNEYGFGDDTFYDMAVIDNSNLFMVGNARSTGWSYDRLWVLKYSDKKEYCNAPGDEDGNGLADCQDVTACPQNAFCGYSPQGIARYCNVNQNCTIPEDCSTPGDEDGNSLADCADPACLNYILPNNKKCENPETSCLDNFDNDNNGLKDCQDPSCTSLPICVHQIQSGWPRDFENMQGAHILVSNLDGIPGNEVVVSFNEKLYVLKADASTLNANWPITAGTNIISVAVGDLNHDGLEEIVVLAEEMGLRVKVYDIQGQIVNLFDKTVANSMSWNSNVVLADVNADNTLEIVVSTKIQSTVDWTVTEHTYIWDLNGNLISEIVSPPGAMDIKMSLAGDINGDGMNEVVVIYDNKINVVNALGQSINPHWPVTLAGNVMAQAVLADLNGDNKDEIIAFVGGTDIHVFNDNAQDLAGWPKTLGNFWANTAIFAIGDLDRNGDLELVVQKSTTMEVFSHDGTNFNITPIDIGMGMNFNKAPLIADIAGDDKPEIIAATANNLYVWDHTGTLVNNFPLPLNGVWGNGTSAVADLDGNGTPELIFHYSNNSMLALTLPKVMSNGSLQWPQLQHDAGRSGNYQGGAVMNTPPEAEDQAVTTNEDTARSIVLHAYDAQGDALTYTVLTGPAHGTLSQVAPDLLYTPAPHYYGSDSFTFKANDGQADSDIGTVAITVVPANDAPVLNNIGSRSVSEGALLSFVVSASDPDGDVLAYSASGLPSGAVFNSGTGSFSWTPTYAQAGTYPVSFTVSDGSLTDSEAITITVVDVPVVDVTMTALTTTTTNIAKGSNLSMSNTVRNQGNLATGAFAIDFHLSMNNIYGDGDDVVLAPTRAVSSLAAGASSASTTAVLIPAATADGTYYICVKADSAAAISEGDENNNTRCIAAPIQVSSADLVMNSLNNPPATIPSGTSVSLPGSVKNQAAGASSSFYIGYYLSADQQITTSDYSLGTVYVSALAGGATLSTAPTLLVPASIPPGTYYLGAIADYNNTRPESDETNNSLASTTQATLSSAVDLTLTAFQSPASFISGTTLSITDTVQNQGTGTAGSFYIAYYRSNDATITTSDTYLGRRSVGTLTSGSSSTATTSFAGLVITPGSYYIGAVVDYLNNQYEINETNNISAASVAVTPGEDMIMTAVSGPSAAVTGGPVTLSDTSKNQGPGKGGSFSVGLYLSTDPVISTSDTRIGTRSVSGLNSQATSTGSTAMTLSATLTPGTYYLGAIADYSNARVELDENNNGLAGAPIVITPGPDLAVNSVSGPASGTRGSAVSISDTVRNQGAGNCSSFYVGYYLSTDAVITTSDIYLGRRSISSLNAGLTSSAATSVTLSTSIPAGTYYIGAVVDYLNSRPEQNENNNTLAGNQIIVQ